MSAQAQDRSFGTAGALCGPSCRPRCTTSVRMTDAMSRHVGPILGCWKARHPVASCWPNASASCVLRCGHGYLAMRCQDVEVETRLTDHCTLKKAGGVFIRVPFPRVA